jgi:hypothetical protein
MSEANSAPKERQQAVQRAPSGATAHDHRRTLMLDAYFVLSRSSGNIVRITWRSVCPPDTPTLTSVRATTDQLGRHAQLYAYGQTLIHLDNVTTDSQQHPTAGDT